MNHPSERELLDYAAAAPGDQSASGIGRHLDECARCRAVARSFSAVEGALHRLPVDRPSPDFNRALFSRLGIREAASIWWLFLRNFVPILMAGTLAIVVISLGPGGGAGSTGQNSLFDMAAVRAWIRAAVDASAVWTAGAAEKIAPGRFGGDAAKLTVFLACLFAGIGLVDRFLLQPMFRRRR